MAANDTLDELRPWMPWAQDSLTPEGVTMVVQEAILSWTELREFQYVILDGDDRPSGIVGCCGLHNRIGPNALEIGYWVRSGHMGRGIATEAARLLTRGALALDGVERVEIHCDEANTRSAAIPRRLGYRLDRVERRPPEAPGETDHHMIWTIGRDGLDEDPGPAAS